MTPALYVGSAIKLIHHLGWALSFISHAVIRAKNQCLQDSAENLRAKAGFGRCLFISFPGFALGGVGGVGGVSGAVRGTLKFLFSGATSKMCLKR